MTCWRCKGSGTYRVTRWSYKHDGYMVTKKVCSCPEGQKLAEWREWSDSHAKVGESA